MPESAEGLRLRIQDKLVRHRAFVPPRKVRSMFRKHTDGATAIRSIFVLTAIVLLLDSDVVGQQPAPVPPSTDSLLTDGSEADDLDALLDLAEEDFGSVSRVNVTAPSLNVEVTTVSRKASTVGRSAAAVFVISSEMIRRSGAINVPEVLRMAPGVQVAQITANQWAISIRGFNGLYSNRLQVQVDGRSVYTPLFGGVIWSSQDVPLSEIERIEIIRGPGASVWGANAVNGIINIMTKNAKDTQGLFLQAGTGTVERGMGNIHYGSKIAEGVFARVHGSWIDHDNFRPGAAGIAEDDYRFGRIGLRIDDVRSEDSQHMLALNYYNGDAGVTSIVPDFTGAPFFSPVIGNQRSEGVNVQWKWDYKISEETKSTLSMYYDRNAVAAPFATDGTELDSEIDIFDIDHQIQHQLNQRHSLVMGAEFKYVDSKIGDVPGFLDFARPERDFYLVSAFLQDEITLIEEKLWFTLGAKISDNSFSGFEFQPTARLLWLPDDKHSVWGAVSRATRLPTFFEVDGTITLPAVATSPLVVFPRQAPADDLKGQDVMAYEIGVRGQPTEEFSWDIAGFINSYSNLGRGNGQTLTPVAPGVAIAASQRGTGGAAETLGVELAGVWDLNDDIRLRGAYTHTQLFGVPFEIRNSNSNQLYLQTSIDVTPTIETDITWRYVDSIPNVVSHYNVMDLRLAWRPKPEFEWSVVARNLFDDKHPEFSSTPTGGVYTQVPTSVYSMITLKY